MGTINLGRVVLGGLLAGLVVNVSESIFNGLLFAQEMEAAMRSLNRPMVGNQAIAWFIVLGFALGIATIWLYAAIRPRFGAGPRTAACAGLTVWFFAYAYPTAGIEILALFPRRLMAIGTVWGLAEIVIASVVGAWAYKE